MNIGKASLKLWSSPETISLLREKGFKNNLINEKGRINQVCIDEGDYHKIAWADIIEGTIGGLRGAAGGALLGLVGGSLLMAISLNQCP